MDDAELLRRYANERSEDAFGEFVQRHINLVYSAALRQVSDPHLAQDVAQTVFVAVASKAATIARHPVPAAWLYTSTHFAAAKMLRAERRRQTREMKSQTMDSPSDLSASEIPWEQLRPILDGVMHGLSERDRQAVLLRFFESHSLAVIGARLGLSEDAAQKRVERALTKLRVLLARRGVTSSSAALAAALSTNAITAAPSGLACAVASAASAGVTATAGSMAVSAFMGMTKLQATLVVAFLLAVGVGIYEAIECARQQSEIVALEQHTRDLSARIRQGREEGAATARQLEETRGRIAAQSSKPDPAEAEMKAWLERVVRLRRLAAQLPERTTPEMRLLSDDEWFKLGQDPNRTDESAFGTLRVLSRAMFSMALGQAARAYVKAHDGQLPAEVRELKPYLVDNSQLKASDADDTMLARYGMRYTGPLSDVPVDERRAVIVEVTSYDEEHDQQMVSGPDGASLARHFNDLTPDTKAALWAFGKAKPGATPDNPAELLPYFRPPLSPARQAKFLQNASTLLPR